MRWKKFLKDSANDTAFVIGSLGAAQIVPQIIRSAVDKPNEPPHPLIPIIGFFNALAMTWGAYFLQYVPKYPRYSLEHPEHSANPALTHFYLGFKILTNIFFMWHFFLIAIFAIYSEVNGKEKQMDDYKEFLPTIIGTLILSILTNASVRSFLWNKYCPQRDQCPVWFWDIISEFCNKYSVLRDIITQCEKIHVHCWGEDDYLPLMAKWIRHGLSIAWGASVGGYMGYYFHPATEPYKIFPERWQGSVSNFLNAFSIGFAITAFTINAGFDINEIASPYWIVFTTGFSALFLAILIRNVFYSQEPAEAPVPPRDNFFTPEQHRDLYKDLHLGPSGSPPGYSPLSSPSRMGQSRSPSNGFGS